MRICWPRRPLERGGCPVDYNERQRAQLWLYTYVCPAIDKFRRILREIGSPEEIFAAPPGALEKFVGADKLARMRRQNSAGFVDALLERLHARGVSFVCRGDEDYPQCFEDMQDFIVPPEVLFMRGERAVLNGRAVAIVGTRSADNEGMEIARDFARDFARAGVNVITGMALGIDAAAAEGALDGGGRVLGVMGCGVDVPYPADNQKLVRRMLDSGSALVSEYLPTTKGMAPFFPVRNRIMAALAEITLIVQAPRRSGALNTASHALNCGHDVFVVPGSIRDARYAGSNALLRDGAAPALESRDVLEAMGMSRGERTTRQAADGAAQAGRQVRGAAERACASGASSANRPKPSLTDDELSVVRLLYEREHSFDEIVSQTDLDTAKLNSLLTMLKIKGIIYETTGKHYRIKDRTET
jgi:DNA processing protein